MNKGLRTRIKMFIAMAGFSLALVLSSGAAVGTNGHDFIDGHGFIDGVGFIDTTP